MITTGVWAPTATARMPSVAVSTYAGATDEIPSMRAAEQTDDIALQTLVCHLVDPSRVVNCELGRKISPRIRGTA